MIDELTDHMVTSIPTLKHEIKIVFHNGPLTLSEGYGCPPTEIGTTIKVRNYNDYISGVG